MPFVSRSRGVSHGLRIAAAFVLLFCGNALSDTLLSTVGSYNVFVLNDFSGTSADVQGALAAGGNINVNMYGVGTLLSAGDVSLFPSGATMVAGGTLTASNGQLFQGNAYAASSPSLTSWNIPNGSSFTGAPIDFTNASTQINDLSQVLAGMAGTPGADCVVASSTVTCTAGGDGLNIINISDPSIFDGNSIDIQDGGHSNVTLVINVAGTADNFGGGSFTAFMNGANVLFNYYEATSIGLAGSFNTSLLAPLATVGETTSGYFNGTFIAYNYTGGQMEFHNTLFNGKVPDASVPEPATFGLVAVGLVLLGWRRSRRFLSR